MHRKPVILFVGGGTVGHIAPLLAVMAAVRERAPEARLVYVGTPADAASPVLRAASGLDFEVLGIAAGKLHRFVSLDQFRQAGRMLAGYVQAKRLLKEVRPDLVFSKGGMVGVPVALAAARLRIPVYSHETDAVPGLANRIVGRYARTIFTAFPVEAYAALDRAKLVQAGQPVRPEFYASDGAWRRLAVGDRELERGGLPIVTVLCGSQGSRQVNGLAREAWPELLKECRLVHLTGHHDFQELRLAAASLPPDLRQNLYLQDFLATGVPELLRASAAVVGRSGGSIFEWAACRTPAILIPLPNAAQDHQRRNAAVLSAAGAALVLDRGKATAANLSRAVLALVASEPERKALATAIAAFDRPEAAATMAEALLAGLEDPAKNG